MTTGLTIHPNQDKYNQRWKAKYPIKHRLAKIKEKARQRGIEFNLTEEDIVIPDVCPVLGTPFKEGTTYCLSTDRIDPFKGYVKGNVQMLSWKANAMKQNATPEELIKFSQWIQKTYTS